MCKASYDVWCRSFAAALAANFTAAYAAAIMDMADNAAPDSYYEPCPSTVEEVKV